MRRIVWGRLTRAWRGHLLALALLVTVTTMLVGLALGAGNVGAATAIETAYEPLDGQPAYEITTRLADDADAQDNAIRSAVAERLGVAHTIDRAVDDGSGEPPFVTWTVTVPQSALDASSVAGLIDAGEELRLGLRNTSAAVRGMEVHDALTPIVEPITETLQPLQYLTLVPALLLLTVGVIVVIQASATLPRSRERALKTLDARGASRLRLAFHSALEALIVGGIGAAAGVALARLVLQPWGGGPLLPQILAGVALSVGLIAASARYSVAQARPTRGVLRRIDTVAILAVVLILTSVTLWRLLRTGLDAVSAPSVGLAALMGALLALVIVAPLGVALAGLMARRRGLVAPLAFRFAARRQAASVPAALLVALAVASMTVAAGFDGTERATRERDEMLYRGAADARIALTAPAPGRPGAPSSAFEEIDGVSAAVGARVTQGAVAQETATVVAVPVHRLGGSLDPEITDALAWTPSGIDLDGMPSELTVTARMLQIEGTEPASDVPVDLFANLRVIDRDGALHDIQLSPVRTALTADPEETTVDVELPEGAVRLIGVALLWEADIEFLENAPWPDWENLGDLGEEEIQELVAEYWADGHLNFESDFVMEVSDLHFGGERMPLVDRALGSEPPFPVYGVLLSAWDGFTQLGDYDLLVPVDEPLAAAVTTPQIAEMFAVEVGETFGFSLDGPIMTGRLAGVSSEVPAARESLAIMVDQGQLTQSLYADGRSGYGPNEMWLTLDGTRGLDEIMDDVLEIDAGASSIEMRIDRTLSSATTALAFWAVAIAAVGLALVGLISLRLSESGEAARESQVLRSLGASPRQIGRAHRGELYARAVPAAVGGALVGVALAYLALPPLVQLANGTVREPVIAVALLPLGVGLALLAAGILVVARVRRRS